MLQNSIPGNFSDNIFHDVDLSNRFNQHKIPLHVQSHFNVDLAHNPLKTMPAVESVSRGLKKPE